MDFGGAFNPEPFLHKGNGDGTVNRRSLIGCQYWRNTKAQQNYPINQVEYADIEHYNMLSASAPINYIVETLTGKGDYPLADEYTNVSNIMKIRLF